MASWPDHLPSGNQKRLNSSAWLTRPTPRLSLAAAGQQLRSWQDEERSQLEAEREVADGKLKLNLDQPPVVTVIGKAFWDISHAPKDQGNKRKYMPGYAAWEIHPVIKLTVQ